MCYNQGCHTNGYGGAFYFRSADELQQSICWAKRPSGHAPAVRVTTSARSLEGRFVMPVSLKCIYCGADFKVKPSRASAKYCSVLCKNRHLGKMRRGKNHHNWSRLTLKCGSCDKEFTLKRSAVQNGDGKYCSLDCYNDSKKGSWAGKKNPNWKPRVEVTCAQCGKKWLDPPSIAHRGENRFCSIDCKAEWQSLNLAGENSYAWEGGSIPRYYGPNWKRQSRQARKRDGYTCRYCGKSTEENGKRLDVHHIVPMREFNYIPGENENYKKANRLKNLISLCVSCHRRVERGAIKADQNTQPPLPLPTVTQEALL